MEAKRLWDQKTYNKRSSGARAPVAGHPSAAIQAMFNDIAVDYDRFNAWASFGLHQVWRRAAVQRIPFGAKVLDIATGTGDLAFLAYSRQHDVVGLDFCEQMLAKAKQKDKMNALRWVYGSADKLPFSDRSFGCITSAFALRNLRGCLDRVFKETFRVLKTGGKAVHLDFGRPQLGLARWGHRMHLSYGVPFIGQWICRERWPKGYLEKTIQEFYEPSEVEQRLEAAGFKSVRHTPLLCGAVQIYEGMKC